MTSERCSTCRYWSASASIDHRNGILKSRCLSEAGAGQYTLSGMSCGEWRPGHHGAIDAAPYGGELARSAYAAEESVI